MEINENMHHLGNAQLDSSSERHACLSFQLAKNLTSFPNFNVVNSPHISERDKSVLAAVMQSPMSLGRVRPCVVSQMK
jgi:hypothetical protein